MDDEEKSTLAHPDKCTDIWACVDVCPTNAIHKPSKKDPPAAPKKETVKPKKK
jgi:NAD-dependent dihydropyrimidine dehydrogenase PreA subunit